MPAELPDLRQIRAFVEVADAASFTQAANKLCLTQSAVSHSIRGLEEQLGSKLVDRVGKRICVTQDGMVFLRRCRRVLQELESAVQELDALHRWGQGRIRIGATHSLCRYLLPSILREFRERFPRCEVHIEPADTAQLISLLDSSKLDIALGIQSRHPQWCRFQALFEDELLFVVSPSHPWAKLDDLTLGKLESESLIVYGSASETYRLIRTHFEEAGVKLRASLSLGDMGAIKEMARTGMGVGIVAPWVAASELQRGELVALPIHKKLLSRTWGAYTHESKEFSVQEEAFVEICEKITKEFERKGSRVDISA